MAEDDVMVLVHGYLAGGFAGKDKCLSGPGDVKGIQMRAAGKVVQPAPGRCWSVDRIHGFIRDL